MTVSIYDEFLMKQSELEIEFNQKVIAKLENYLPFKLLLDVELDKSIPLKQSQIESTINGIVNVSLLEFNKLNSNESKSGEKVDSDSVPG